MFPAEAGWPQEKGVTHYVLQLHYNNAQKLPNQKDSTGYDFCTSNKLRPNDAGMLAFGKVDLIRNQIAIPARSNLHEVECSYTLPNNVPEIRFFAASPHMHKFGKTSSTYYTRAGSTTPTKLIDVKEFGFDSQVSYPVSGAAKAGDRFKTRCGWTNPSDKTVYWGEGTGDEMCYNFTMYYPRVPDVPSQLFGLGGFNWGTPSLESTCQVVSK
jgi:hypothetical protein